MKEMKNVHKKTKNHKKANNIMRKVDFEENEIYLKICSKLYNFEN